MAGQYREILPNNRGEVRLNRFTLRRVESIVQMDESVWSVADDITSAAARIVGFAWSGPRLLDPDQKYPNENEKGSSRESDSSESPQSPEVQQAEERRTEIVGIHSDEATVTDQLGRRPFAKAIVERLDEVYEKNGIDGFAIHIHAPWGAGKSSVLHMMQQMMEATDRSRKGGIAQRWVVVNFDAWKNERRNPPWWPLVQDLLTAGFSYTRTYNEAAYYKLKLHWFWWRLKTEFLAVAVSVLVGCLTAILFGYFGNSSVGLLDVIFKLVTAGFAMIGSFIAASRLLTFGSSLNVKIFEEMSQDPMLKIRALFEKIILFVNAPVCFFIEDIDRCRPEYVVGLLRGIQTIFRHRNVAYVVTGDRAWVRSSFESQYKELKADIGTPGQPLGYLFIEKLFQMSVPLPAVDSRTRAAYWEILLNGTDDGAVAQSGLARAVASELEVEDERRIIRGQTQNLTRNQAEAMLQDNDSPARREALALELSSSQAVKAEATHLLAEFKDCVPEIPRVMKRMINAYAIRQAMGFLQGSGVPVKVLARWTIIEQSDPALADALMLHPNWVEENAELSEGDAITELLRSTRIRDVIGRGGDRLTPEFIRRITHGDEKAES